MLLIKKLPFFSARKQGVIANRSALHLDAFQEKAFFKRNISRFVSPVSGALKTQFMIMTRKLRNTFHAANFFLSMRTLEPAQNILCHAHIFCLKSSLARKMLGFVKSGFLSRAQTTIFSLDKKPDSTNPRISLAKLD